MSRPARKAKAVLLRTVAAILELIVAGITLLIAATAGRTKATAR